MFADISSKNIFKKFRLPLAVETSVESNKFQIQMPSWLLRITCEMQRRDVLLM